MYIWNTKQQTIAVVNAGSNECVDQSLCSVISQVFPNSSDVT